MFTPSRYALTGAQFLEYKRPLVYVWKRGDEYMYVGLGACGVGRMFGTHPCLKHIRETDTLSWTFFETVEEAKRVERRLIANYKPAHNVALKK